jgi:carbamoyl-phosphate synthase small subunit
MILLFYLKLIIFHLLLVEGKKYWGLMAYLIFDSGKFFKGSSFGYEGEIDGELVFNTGMMGYPESLTDPSYSGQILVITYPLVGNYGVAKPDKNNMDWPFESDKIHIKGLIISEYSEKNSHHSSVKSLSSWLKENKIPALSGIDTRMLTKHIRDNGNPTARISMDNQTAPKKLTPVNEIEKVSSKKRATFGEGDKTVVVIDMGCKNNIIRSLVERGLKVIRVPWNDDLSGLDFDGVLISNGPGNPEFAKPTVKTIKSLFEKNIPTFGICMGNQGMAMAAGAKTFKMLYGHRGQNQPCLELGTNRVFLTSQNHSYAIDEASLPSDWEPWFRNANDQTNEGQKLNCPFIP